MLPFTTPRRHCAFTRIHLCFAVAWQWLYVMQHTNIYTSWYFAIPIARVHLTTFLPSTPGRYTTLRPNPDPSLYPSPDELYHIVRQSAPKRRPLSEHHHTTQLMEDAFLLFIVKERKGVGELASECRAETPPVTLLTVTPPELPARRRSRLRPHP